MPEIPKYNLPWVERFGVSLLLIGIDSFLPNHGILPLSLIFGLIIVAFYSFRPYEVHPLGLSLKLGRGAKKALIIILLAFTLFNVLMVIITQAAKAKVIEEGEVTQEIKDMLPFDFDPRDIGETSPAFEKAVLNGNMPELLSSFWRPALATFVYAPIVESVFFFAILFPALWRRLTFFKALTLTCTYVAFMHFIYLDTYSIVFYVIFGIASIWIYVRTTSLYPVILLHALWNLTGRLGMISVNWGLQTTYADLLP